MAQGHGRCLWGSEGPGSPQLSWGQEGSRDLAGCLMPVAQPEPLKPLEPCSGAFAGRGVVQWVARGSPRYWAEALKVVVQVGKIGMGGGGGQASSSGSFSDLRCPCLSHLWASPA